MWAMSITGHSISQWLPCPVSSWVPNTIGTWGGNSVKFSSVKYRLDLNMIGIFTSFVGKSLDEIEI